MNVTTNHRPARMVGFAAGAAVLAQVLVGGPAAARSPQVVDPATVTPALNPNFDWSCWEAGSGITCQGTNEDTYADPAGFQCDGQDVYLTGSGRERVTRWHTADGLATKTVVHLDYPGDVFSLSPTGDGPSLTIRGHFQRHYSYGTPGDLTTRVQSEIGAIYLANSAGHGLVIHDAGKVTFAEGQGSEVVDSTRGVHDVFTDPDIVEEAVCAAIG